MNPLLSGRGIRQSTSGKVEELSQLAEQKTITEEEHNLSRETRNCNKDTAAFEHQQLKNSKKNIMK